MNQTLAGVVDQLVATKLEVQSSIAASGVALDGVVGGLKAEVQKSVDAVDTVATDMTKERKALQGDVDALKTFAARPPTTEKTAKTCGDANEGEIRFNLAAKAAEACSAKKWVAITGNIPAQVGTKENPGRDCRFICAARGNTAKNGDFWATVNGQFPTGIEVYCDCQTEGGGWTLFASKKAPGAPLIARDSAGGFQKSCLKTRGNCPSVIPPNSIDHWREILFRFDTKENAAKDGTGAANTFTIWVRASDAGSRSAYNSDFAGYFNRGHLGRHTSPTVCGFWRRQSWVAGRNPAVGPKCVGGMHYGWGGQISEAHSNSDDWIDLWNGRDGTDSYDRGDGGAAHGTKCVASYCSLNDPVLLMYR